MRKNWSNGWIERRWKRSSLIQAPRSQKRNPSKRRSLSKRRLIKRNSISMRGRRKKWKRNDSNGSEKWNRIDCMNEIEKLKKACRWKSTKCGWKQHTRSRDQCRWTKDCWAYEAHCIRFIVIHHGYRIYEIGKGDGCKIFLVKLHVSICHIHFYCQI